MHNDQINGVKPQKDARWPVVFVYVFMVGGMFGISNNSDAIAFDFSPAALLGLLICAGAMFTIAYGRLRGHTVFDFGDRTVLQNIARHSFIVTGIIFLSFLFFDCATQILILAFHVPIFGTSCVVPSQRDVSWFVWDAMARGAFKFLAGYLGLAEPDCAPNATGTATSALTWLIKLFTSLVLMWYAFSLAKAWYARPRPS
jgi:hypothetical protein